MFSLLQVPESTNHAVEIIKAVGGTWPFLLTVTAILFLLFNRKSISKYFGKFNKVSGKTPIIELSLESSKSNTKVEENESQQAADTPKIEEFKKEEINKKKDPDFYDIYLKLKEGDFDGAETFFNEMQNLETDLIRKEKNEYILLSFKYQYAGVNTINDLKEKVNKASNNNLKYFGYKTLARVFFVGKNYSESLANYKLSLEYASNELEKIDIVLDIAKCMKESGEKVNAINYLKEFKDEAITAENKSKIFKQLASLYSEKNEWLLRCLALEMAISHNPNDTDLLFELGYSYSNRYDDSDDKIVSLALLHYTELVKYNTKSPAGLNNLGVAYSDLDMKGEAIKYYKKAIELGNSLAASNLANKYIDGGFYVEARETIEKVKDKKDVNENVWTSLNELTKREKLEIEKGDQTFKKAKEDQIFIKKFANIYFGKEFKIKNLEGEWMYNADVVQVKLSPNYDYYELVWTSNNNNFSVVFKITDTLSLIGEGSHYPKGGGTTKKLNAFAILNEDNNQIDLLLFDKWDKTSFRFLFIKK